MPERNEPPRRPAIGQIDRVIHEPARYHIMACLAVVEQTDALFLLKQTGLTWGNLSTHLSKLEAAGYIEVTKEFLGKKPHTLLAISKQGREAFETYRAAMKQALAELPEL